MTAIASISSLALSLARALVASPASPAPPAPPAPGAPPAVVLAEPTLNTMSATASPLIRLAFDAPLDPATVTPASFRVLGKWSGLVPGALALSPDGMEITFHPSRPFTAGDLILVQASHAITGMDGTPIRSAGHAWQFMTPAAAADMSWMLAQDVTTNRVGESSRPYGGVATDMNGDGFPDITITNEDTADLRVFLNRADGTCRTEPVFLEPTAPLADGASPSDVADFDHDGDIDLCITCNADDRIVILDGDGAGGFVVSQSFTVSGTPRGIVAFDVDGDGDDDIVVANDGTSRLMLLVNDGTGLFAAPTSFDAPTTSERSLAAADMDEDGILDLVVGGINDARMIVMRGHGDGTWSTVANVPAGGASWMIMLGDLNGDGHADVTSVNGFSNNASVLFGDGAGGLSAPTIYVPDAFPLATDLGDLDGDGDLDWVTSSYSGDFFVYRNEGDGSFTFVHEFLAPSNASCALLADFDGDRDLDVALIDEIADRLILHENAGTPPPTADLDGDGDVGFADLLLLLSAWGPCAGCPADIDGDGAVAFADLLQLLSAWTTDG